MDVLCTSVTRLHDSCHNPMKDARHNHEHGQNRRSHNGAPPGPSLAGRLVLFYGLFILEESKHDTQIEEGTDVAARKGNHGQHQMAGSDHCFEDEEFGEETGQWRYAGQGEDRERQQDGGQGVFSEACVQVIQVVAVTAQDTEAGAGGDGGDGIDGYVVQERFGSPSGVVGKRKHHVACVGNGGVGQHSLEAGLVDGGDVAMKKRQDREDGYDRDRLRFRVASARIRTRPSTTAALTMEARNAVTGSLALE